VPSSVPVRVSQIMALSPIINVVCSILAWGTVGFITAGLGYSEVWTSDYQSFGTTNINYQYHVGVVNTCYRDNLVDSSFTCFSNLEGNLDGEQCSAITSSDDQDDCNKFFSSMKAAFSFFILGSVLNAIQALGFFLHFFYPSSVYASKGPVLSLINSALVFFCYLIAFPCAYGGSRDYVDYLSRQSTSVNLEFGLSSGLFSAAFGVQFLLLLASIYGMAGECKSEAERRSTMVGETVTLPGELTTKSFETAASTESQVRDCC